MAFNPDPSQKNPMDKNKKVVILTDEQKLDKIIADMNVDKNQFDLNKLEIEAARSCDFYKKLNGMTERVKVFNTHFNDRRPRFELNFKKR